MKRDDILLLAVSAVVSGILSLALVNLVFKPTKHTTKVEVVEKITSEFANPSEKYFNAESNNPTQQIQIGTGNNQVQFGQ